MVKSNAIQSTSQSAASVEGMEGLFGDDKKKPNKRTEKRTLELLDDSIKDVDEEILDDSCLEEIVGNELDNLVDEEPEAVVDPPTVDVESSDEVLAPESEVQEDEDFDGQTAEVDDHDDPETEGFEAANLSGAEDRPVGTSVARQSDTDGQIVSSDDRVSKNDLIGILEGFVKILRTDDTASGTAELRKAQGMVVSGMDIDASVEDKTQELEEMRRLVIEAQETIIKLLGDRVEDRARIATLETELKLLPDLQEQADRAMAVAFKTEEFRSELHKVKYELEKSRIASVRKSMYAGPKGLLTRVQHWLLKARGTSHRQFADENKHQ